MFGIGSQAVSAAPAPAAAAPAPAPSPSAAAGPALDGSGGGGGGRSRAGSTASTSSASAAAQGNRLGQVGWLPAYEPRAFFYSQATRWEGRSILVPSQLPWGLIPCVHMCIDRFRMFDVPQTVVHTCYDSNSSHHGRVLWVSTHLCDIAAPEPAAVQWASWLRNCGWNRVRPEERVGSDQMIYLKSCSVFRDDAQEACPIIARGGRQCSADGIRAE